MAPLARIVPIDRSLGSCSECRMARRCLAAPGGCEHLVAGSRLLHRGDHLIRNGQTFEAVYVVRSGALKSYMLGANGEEHVIAFHSPGELLGIDGIETEEHVSNTIALDTSSVCVLGFDRLCETAARTPALQRALLANMSRRVRCDEARLRVLGLKSADQRIATFLVEQARRGAELGFPAEEINLPMPRADIASYLSLAVETVSRVLTRLQEAGILRVRRNRIGLLDAEALLAVSEDPADAPALARAR